MGPDAINPCNKAGHKDPFLRRYLYTSTQPGVVEYLCNRLFDLGEGPLDSYLLQLVYLAVAKPGGPLEKTLVELSSRSFKLALKVGLRRYAWGREVTHGAIDPCWLSSMGEPSAFNAL